MKRWVFVAFVVFLMGGAASAALIDTVAPPTAFFAMPGQVFQPLYWRSAGQDWQWQHGPIADPVGSAELSIEAFDVDEPAEIDEIFAWDAGTTSWMSLGPLEGTDDHWSYTNFSIGSDLYDDIASGLLLKIDIDTADLGYKVTLGRSILTVNGTTNPDSDPDPDPVIPTPGSLILCALGAVTMAWMKRRLIG